LFYGTPALAVPFLDLLARKSAVVGVLTNPDKPVGRSLRVQPPPVKARALELGLSVLQPERPADAVAPLAALKPELAVAVAYGKFLPPELLAVPALGSLNVHFSLLPKYRGAAPVQWSLVRGESRTGVTVFWIEGGFDTGPVFLQRGLDIGPDEDAGGLFARLSPLGLRALEEALDELGAGRIRKEPQAGQPSLAPLIRREDARVSFSQPARRIHDLVRGLRLWPTAYIELQPPAPRLVQVHRTRLPGPDGGSARGSGAGLILCIEPQGGILVQCSDCSSVWLLTVQPEGKKPVAAADFLNGLRLGVGDFLPLA
ncbi:MAG: methionyl-tRNA formyltransferase, partial [Elusimicrobia bacterium]|nr:methionyl-tRNA formyltransferase [Elusimicrobiota bacterium]